MSRKRQSESDQGLFIARSMLREAEIRRASGQDRMAETLEEWACNAWCRSALARLRAVQPDLFDGINEKEK